jgi:pimeloyl-ACP methyl ester carboxylesterase
MRSDGVPEVRYARSGDVSIAYQLVGDSPRDLVFVPTFSNLVYPWWNEDFRTFYERLGAFARLILLDKRGTGLSDRPRDLGTLESRIDDIRAVLDAAGSKTAILLGTGEGGQICTFFAATYPERTQALILYGTPARAVRDDDYPFGPTSEQWRELVREVRERWGEREYFEQQAREAYGATAADELVDWYVECQRFCASPGAAVAFYRSYGDTDIREVLATVRVPTLVLYRQWNRDQSLDLAARTPIAQTIELLTRHRTAVRRQLARFRGTEVDTAGDGFFATFDGPARAILCASEVVADAHGLGLSVRAGVHTGECDLSGEKVAGVAVHIGARVAAEASAGEILVSRTVKDLVAGSGLEFDDRGVRELKGVPESWQLFAVRSMRSLTLGSTSG